MSQISFPNYKLKAERIFCIGCNYSAHIEEIGFQKEKDGCVIFMKPNTSLVQQGTPLSIPLDQGEVHNEVELVLCIGKEGKNIPKENALDFIKGLSLGLDLTLRNKQTNLKQKGHPWELCKAFDNSAPIGDFTDFDPKDNWQDISFSCFVNGEKRQQGIAGDMLYPIDLLIQIISETWKLLPGDLIFTGTPLGVGPLKSGDHIQIESSKLGTWHWEITK